MHMSRLFVMSCLLGSALVACGDDGGKGGGNVDAPKQIDAPAADAPPAGGPTALGKKCTAPTDCPANAPECIHVADPMTTNAYCTPKCLTGGTGTTNAQGGLALSAITPAPNNTTCTTAFTGTPAAGQIGCGVIMATTPADNPLMANKQYTNIELGCIVLCGTGMVCPTGMTCSAATGNKVCLPN